MKCEFAIFFSMAHKAPELHKSRVAATFIEGEFIVVRAP